MRRRRRKAFLSSAGHVAVTPELCDVTLALDLASTRAECSLDRGGVVGPGSAAADVRIGCWNSTMSPPIPWLGTDDVALRLRVDVFDLDRRNDPGNRRGTMMRCSSLLLEPFGRRIRPDEVAIARVTTLADEVVVPVAFEDDLDLRLCGVRLVRSLPASLHSRTPAPPRQERVAQHESLCARCSSLLPLSEQAPWCTLPRCAPMKYVIAACQRAPSKSASPPLPIWPSSRGSFLG